jgi:hypothetical protein
MIRTGACAAGVLFGVWGLLLAVQEAASRMRRDYVSTEASFSSLTQRIECLLGVVV